MKKNVCVLVADGSEEMEVVITVDVLRRAGIGVFVAGVGEETRMVTTSRGVRIAPDGAWDPAEASRFDMLVIPGGIGGTQAMLQEPTLLETIREFMEGGKWVASLCAGPMVLQAAGVLKGRTFTSHPSRREDLTDGTWVDEPFVVDGKLVTSQAPGTAFAFALGLVEILVSAEAAARIAEGMRYRT